MSDALIELFVENGTAKASLRLPAAAFDSFCESEQGASVLTTIGAIASAPAPAPQAQPTSTAPQSIYVVCRAFEKGGGIEQVLGVFFDFDLAVAQCVSPLDFVGPLRANAVDSTADWPGVVFPRRKQTRATGGAA